jgi:hypothetical protein
MRTFKVWNPDDNDEDGAQTVRASDPEHAAEIWAENDDQWSADYLIVSGRSEPVVTVVAEDGSRTRFRVTGETVARYSACEVDETEEGK